MMKEQEQIRAVLRSAEVARVSLVVADMDRHLRRCFHLFPALLRRVMLQLTPTQLNRKSLDDPPALGNVSAQYAT
jgi:hypothetical protein